MAECPTASCLPLSAHGLQGVVDQAAQVPLPPVQDCEDVLTMSFVLVVLFENQV